MPRSGAARLFDRRGDRCGDGPRECRALPGDRLAALVLIVWVFIPVRDAFLWMPFAAVLALLGTLGYAVGGRRSAVICLAFFGYIAVSGWWDRTMTERA